MSPTERDAATFERVPGELISASVAGNVHEVQAIIDRWRRDYGTFKSTPFEVEHMTFQEALYVAVANRQPSAVSCLLDQGFPIDLRAVDLAVHIKSTIILQIFLDHGWDINKPISFFSPSSLIWAVQDEQLTKWYISHHADPNSTCTYGSTPMATAVFCAPLSTVKLLVEHGGRVQNNDLLISAAEGYAEPTTPESGAGRMQVIRYLLDCGAPTDVLQHQYNPAAFAILSDFGPGLRTALHVAAAAGKLDLVALLLESGADRDVEDTKGRTALQVAMRAGHEQVMSLLTSR